MIPGYDRVVIIRGRRLTHRLVRQGRDGLAACSRLGARVWGGDGRCFCEEIMHSRKLYCGPLPGVPAPQIEACAGASRPAGARMGYAGACPLSPRPRPEWCCPRTG